jgi:GNAT superfamily N-acetyltransferase
MLGPLAPLDREALVASMERVRALLANSEPASTPRNRPLQTGDIGWIIHRQALLYAEEYGWDVTYEALVAEILGAFVKNFDGKSDAAWIVEWRGSIVGSVFLVRASERVAKLCLLYVEPAARGLGIGRKLVSLCIAGARERGYRKLTRGPMMCSSPHVESTKRPDFVSLRRSAIDRSAMTWWVRRGN